MSAPIFTSSPAANHGFPAHELNEIEGIVKEHRAMLIEAWNEYFG